MNDNKSAWHQLSQAGLVSGEAPEADELESPWYVNVILAFSGWFSSFFFLGFLGLAVEIFEKPVVAAIVGGIIIAGSYVLLNTPKRNVFLEHLALAFSLAGQLLIAWTIFEGFGKAEIAMLWFTIAAFQFALSMIMPNFIHGVMSSLFAALCLSVGLSFAGVSYLATSLMMAAAVLIWLHEFNHPQYINKKRASGYGLILASIVVKGFFIFGLDLRNWGGDVESSILVMPWVGELLLGVVTLYLVWKILQRLELSMTSPISIAAFAGTFVLSLASIEASGITVGWMIVLMGFANSNKVLMGLGVATLLFNISSYYYLLNNTLMEKAQTMLLIGLVLLTVRWLMRRLAREGQAAAHE